MATFLDPGRGDMGLMALLLSAARVIQEREDASTDSDSSDMLVPQAAPSGSWRSSKTKSRRAALDIDDGSSSEDDGSVPIGRSRGRGAAGPAKQAQAAGRKAARGPMQHNEVEKRRRAYLAACYVELKTILPSIADSKASNVSILRTAVEQIQHLDDTQRQLDAELAQLQQQRKQLLVGRRLAPRQQPREQQHGAAFAALMEASGASSSDDGDSELEVPDATNRSVSPEMEETLTYTYSPHHTHGGGKHAVHKHGGYYEQHHGGGAIRRRSRSRPARFL